MQSPPTKNDLLEYFEQLLHGPTGHTSAAILADIAMQMIREEKERALEIIAYQVQSPAMKKEFIEYTWQIHSSVLAGPTYSTTQS